VPHPPSTIGKVLRRHGCSRLPRPAGAARCARRYERERPGELRHVDTKKLGRFWRVGKRILARRALAESKGAGWQWLHVAIDVDRPRFGGQAVFMPLFLLSFSRTRPVSGSRAWSGA
jgi:hypothetical protein